jgi:hypothetical protein
MTRPHRGPGTGSTPRVIVEACDFITTTKLPVVACKYSNTDRSDMILNIS